MNIGIIGLGKLGLPVALAIQQRGHHVWGYDIDQTIRAQSLEARKFPHKEEGAQELLDQHRITWSPPEQMVGTTDVIFVAVQTPHDVKYEGITRIPPERADFDYSWLKQSVSVIAAAAQRAGVTCRVAVISTVLPGTIAREIKPLLNRHVSLIYHPLFIAMGTVIPDFFHPEFALLGHDDDEESRKTAELVRTFCGTIHSAPVIAMPIIDAELTKVAYNTFVGMKIVFANTLMEISHRMGGNVDNVTGALAQGTQRLLSPRYFTGGMGDGGGCHPRDNIAMSGLARSLSLSHDLFDDIMKAREDQTQWLADVAAVAARGLPVVILGKAFKPQTALTVGSPSILLFNLFKERHPSISLTHYDPLVDAQAPAELDAKTAAVFVIGARHDVFEKWQFPRGSIVIDPFGYITPSPDVEVIHIGRAGSPSPDRP